MNHLPNQNKHLIETKQSDKNANIWIVEKCDNSSSNIDKEAEEKINMKFQYDDNAQNEEGKENGPPPAVGENNKQEASSNMVNNEEKSGHMNEGTENGYVIQETEYWRTGKSNNNNKPKLSATLEEKVEFMKKLTKISMVYSQHVSEQLNTVMAARKLKVAHCKSQHSNVTSTSKITNDYRDVIMEEPHPGPSGLSADAKWFPGMIPRIKLTPVQVGQDAVRSDVKENRKPDKHSKNFDNPLFEGTLKDYQVDGVEWLKILYENAVNGILADEMGLGKTVQTIGLLCHLINKNVKGPFLIVAPLSTLPNWISEFKKFCPKVPVTLFHGSADHRKMLVKRFGIQTLPNDKRMFPVIITSFQIPMREETFFSKYKWKYLVVDEGHRLKNRNSKLSRFLRRLESENRLLLTGTPLQNNLEELWSLLHFLTPEIFGNSQEFELLVSSDDLQSNAIIEQEIKEGIISKMHMALSPFLLRRMKKDVDLKLPPKKEILVCAPMSRLQWELYNATINGSILQYLGLAQESEMLPSKRKCTQDVRYSVHDESDDELVDDDETIRENYFRVQCKSIGSPTTSTRSNRIHVDKEGNEHWINLKMQQPLIQLRKLCNHPYLVKMPLDSTGRLLIDEKLIKTSGKMMLLDVLLPHLKARGHKVLLFSTMTKLLDLIEEYAVYRDYEYSRLDGSVTLDDRTIEINRFLKDTNVFLFLISTRAGSLGLNLTSADTVIIFDSDWNPQVDLQAQDRCHRIGQTKPVVVYRFLTEATIDEKIVQYAERKRRLEKLILHSDCYKGLKHQKPESFVSVQELKDLLASKDYSKVVHSSGMVLQRNEITELVDRSRIFD